MGIYRRFDQKASTLLHICHLIIKCCSDSCCRLHGYTGAQKKGGMFGCINSSSTISKEFKSCLLAPLKTRKLWCQCQKSKGSAPAPEWDPCQETPVLRQSFSVKKTLHNHNVCPGCFPGTGRCCQCPANSQSSCRDANLLTSLHTLQVYEHRLHWGLTGTKSFLN